MRRLSSLGSKQLAHRKGRSALTATGIALGVAILFGVLVSNATTQTGVDQLISDFTGNADVLVNPPGSFDATMPASQLQRIEALPDVRLAVGSFRFFGSLPRTGGGDALEPSVTGIDLRTASQVFAYELAEGRFWRGDAIEIVIPARLATDAGLKVGDRARLGTPFGIVEVPVVGLLTDTGAGRTNQGEVAFTSIGAARTLARVGAVLSGARLVLDDRVEVEPWIKANRDAIEGLDFQNAESLAQGFKDFLGILGGMFTIFAAMTLFVGAFLIYLTLSMAVIERTRMYGTMRALGATRGQVRRVVVYEALALGAVSTVVGLFLGLLIAQGLLVLIGNLFEIDMPGLTIRPGAVIAGLLVGILTTLASALIPARRASHLSPVVAMRGDYAAETRLSKLWRLGLVLLLVGIVGGTLGGGGATALGILFMLIGAVLMVPLLLRPLARLLGRITGRIAAGAGDIAVLHLVKERSRSAYTLALIMVVMGMIFSIGGLQEAILRQVDQTLDRQFGADLQIEPGGAVAEDFVREVRAIEGVGAVTPLGFARTESIDAAGEETEIFVLIIDPTTYFDVGGFPITEGTEAGVEQALTAGGAILVPSSELTSLGGDDGSVTLRTLEGPREFRVAAPYTNIGGPPAIIMSLSDAREFLGSGRTFRFVQANVEPGASVPEVRARVQQQLSDRYTLSIDDPSDAKAEARTQIGQFFSIFYAIVLVAAIVGLLGLANTLAMSVLQRYREIGVLRAIGTTRGQVRRMVLVESATLGLVAFALSLPLGLALSVTAVRGMASAFGIDIPYVYPSGWVPLVAAFGIVIAMLAAVAPGRRAARLEVVSALQYE